jgi:hypothetical protein
MNDQISALRDDLSYMRELAEDGRTAPSLGGTILVSAGVVFAIASVGQWTLASGAIVASPWASAIVWGAALAVFLVSLVIFRLSMRGRPGTNALGSRAAGAAWAGVGWGIMTMLVVINIICNRTHSQIPLMLLPSMVLALYGVGWAVAAVVSRKTWIWGIAVGAYLAALVVAWFSDTPSVFLIYAACLVGLLAVPGLALMRAAPAAE